MRGDHAHDHEVISFFAQKAGSVSQTSRPARVGQVGPVDAGLDIVHTCCSFENSFARVIVRQGALPDLSVGIRKGVFVFAGIDRAVREKSRPAIAQVSAEFFQQAIVHVGDTVSAAEGGNGFAQLQVVNQPEIEVIHDSVGAATQSQGDRIRFFVIESRQDSLTWGHCCH